MISRLVALRQSSLHRDGISVNFDLRRDAGAKEGVVRTTAPWSVAAGAEPLNGPNDVSMAIRRAATARHLFVQAYAVSDAGNCWIGSRWDWAAGLKGNLQIETVQGTQLDVF